MANPGPPSFAVPPGQLQTPPTQSPVPTSQQASYPAGAPYHYPPQQQLQHHPPQPQQQQHSVGGGPPQPHPPPQAQQHAPPYPPQQHPHQPTSNGIANNYHTTPPPSANASPAAPRKNQLEDDVVLPRQPDEETEDGRKWNREAASWIRDRWIYQQVSRRRDEFTQYKQATLFTGTWNVNAKGKEEPLDPWLFADWASGSPDIVAVGFQEIVDLNAVNVAVDNKTQQRSQFWVERLLATLNSRESYVMLMQKSLVGLLVCVFVKAPHQSRVRYVHADSVGVGVMGMMGNKGGCSIRMQFYDSTICFVCSHLAAHRENVTGRNADFANVYTKTTFDIGEEAIREVIRSGSLAHGAIGSSFVRIPDHDIVVWLGDLNYRVDESMMTEKVLQLSEKMILEEIRTLDQLNVERAAGRVFENFEEGALTFPPTYKYQPGTDIYEQRPDKKLRAPAWCDRILWMAEEPQHVQQLTYGRSEKPNCSDHKPVYSTMRLTIKDVIQQKREAIYNELMKLLDRFENQTLPMVGLDRITLDYGEVHYGQSKMLPIQITNTGSVVAQFRLAPKLDEQTVCKRFLRISPAYGMLIPGENPININCTLTIDNTTAQLLNSGREVLDDILILRLENGRDYYITVKATYARSCFGMSVDELVMYSDPIRSIPIDAIKRSERMERQKPTALCVPKELWRTIDAICELGVQTPHLFTEPGIAEEVSQIRECLDTGSRFGRYRIHSYADTLVSFLESLSPPIIPYQLFPGGEIDSMTIQSSSRQLLEDLAPIHYNVFLYVISFFRELLTHRERNLLSAAKVARICCSSMAPGKGLDNSSASVQKRTNMQLILLHLLETSSI